LKDQIVNLYQFKDVVLLVAISCNSFKKTKTEEEGRSSGLEPLPADATPNPDCLLLALRVPFSPCG